MWVLDYVEDIASDMSVFHRIDDADAMPAPLYFERAERLPAYQGVMRARLSSEAQEAGGTPAATPGTVEVSEDIALARLANEGWLEHTVEGAA